MVESFYKTFEEFVVEFSPRRFAAAILLAIIGLGCLAIFEWYTSYFTLGRLERATALLERLATLKSNDQVATDEKLQAIRSDITIQLRKLVEPAPRSVFSRRIAIWKFAAGFTPWLLFALAYLRNVRTDRSNWNPLMGALFMGAVFGFAGLLIPSAWVTWASLISYSVGHFLLVFLAVSVWQARKLARAVKPAG